jgi:hypothetical protein
MIALRAVLLLLAFVAWVVALAWVEYRFERWLRESRRAGR